MPWFKVDDSFYDHPKVFDAPDCAVALWIRAGTWSARNLTDGFVPTGMPARLCSDHDVAVRQLLDRGLWRRTKGGYTFHDWNRYQLSREEVEATREKLASGGALGNHRRWHVDKGVNSPDCGYCLRKRDRPSDRPPDRVGDGVGESPPNPPVPSRPVPSSSVISNYPDVKQTNNDEDRQRRINYTDLADRMRPLIGTIDASHAERIAGQVLALANGDVGNPTNYVLTAVAREPNRFRPSSTPPRVQDLCRHGLTRCQECAEETPF